MKLHEIREAISAERTRQEELKKAGKFSFTCADKEPLPETKFLILMEECLEVAREIQEIRHMGEHEKLKEELIQVCAVCVAWLESL